MKKILYTSALVSAVIFTGVANAETKVTGNLGLSYIAVADGAASSKASWQGFGKESQINVSNSGDLNNGWKYAAGIAIEMDGGDFNGAAPTENSTQKQQAENTYIDFINGGTTISIGNDHTPNTEGNRTNIVGFGFISADGHSQSKAAGAFNKSTSNYQAPGIAVLQNLGGSDVALVRYAPNSTASSYCNDILNDATKARCDATPSTYEVMYRGGFGVKGLSVTLQREWNTNGGSTLNDENRGTIDAVYNMGKITVAAEQRKSNVASSSATAGDNTSKAVGIAYAIDDKMSIGYTYGKASIDSTSATPDEKTSMVALGYNLGAVSAQVQYKTVSDLNNVNGADGKSIAVYFGTKF